MIETGIITIQKIVLGKGNEAYFIEMFVDTGRRAEGMATFQRMYKSWRPR